ncbi:hypothetical protein HK104_008901 [Borealophlyctis nickersoniae]|nr:hypothetical protein HK104_008901 [Borealophlyctis nickersoniae]
MVQRRRAGRGSRRAREGQDLGAFLSRLRATVMSPATTVSERQRIIADIGRVEDEIEEHEASIKRFEEEEGRLKERISENARVIQNLLSQATIVNASSWEKDRNLCKLRERKLQLSNEIVARSRSLRETGDAVKRRVLERLDVVAGTADDMNVDGPTDALSQYQQKKELRRVVEAALAGLGQASAAYMSILHIQSKNDDVLLEELRQSILTCGSEDGESDPTAASPPPRVELDTSLEFIYRFVEDENARMKKELDENLERTREFQSRIEVAKRYSKDGLMLAPMIVTHRKYA